ncbi:hypothetical protein GCM10010199_21750 [Dactylosporangium roseum]
MEEWSRFHVPLRRPRRVHTHLARPSLPALAAVTAVVAKEIEGKFAESQKRRRQVYGTGGATGVLKPVACPVDHPGGPGGTAATKACSLIGRPHISGAAGPDGYDCSGMTLTASANVTRRSPWRVGAHRSSLPC